MWDDIYTTFINLPEEHARRAFMESQLRELSIPYTILTGVIGKTFDFTSVYDEAKAIQYHGAPLTSTEKGCALSHRNALEAFLATDKAYALILEDDVVLDASLPQAIKHALEARDWSYVQFNYGPVGLEGVHLWWFLFLKNRKKYTPLRFLFTTIKGLFANALSLLWGIRDTWYRVLGKGKLARLMRDQYLAGCYLITRDAAQELIKLNTPLIYTADRAQNIARRKNLIKERIYIPRIVRQKRESFASSINNEHFGKDIIAA